MFKGKHWKDDILAGFVIFLIALPLSIGISIAAGAPASAGILSAILGGLVGSLITGNNVAINGPAAGLIVVILGSITSLSDGDPMLGFKRTLAATAVAGVLQIFSGLMKWGRLAFLAPVSVVHGMLSAIGFIILIKQIPVLLGVKPHAKSLLGLIGEIPNIVIEADVPIAAIGFICLSVLVLLNTYNFKIKKLIPGPLQAVGVGLVASLAIGIAHAHDINLLNHKYHVGPEFLVKVPDRFFDLFIFPSFDIIFSVRSLVAILTIFIVTSLESLLSSYAVDKLDPQKRKSDLDKDLLGKGVVNLMCGMLGAYPIISEIVRSSANIENGAKTNWANFFHGLFILLFVALLPGVINEIPLASLAAVLLIVGWNLAHPRHFKAAFSHGWDQFLFFMTTLVVTVVEDLLMGIAAGILLQIIFHLARGVKLGHFFNPDIKVNEHSTDNVIIEFGSPVVFLGYLKLQKVLKEHQDKIIKVETNGHYVDFTIHELIKDSIHDAVDLAHAEHQPT